MRLSFNFRPKVAKQHWITACYAYGRRISNERSDTPTASSRARPQILRAGQCDFDPRDEWSTRATHIMLHRQLHVVPGLSCSTAWSRCMKRCPRLSLQALSRRRRPHTSRHLRLSWPTGTTGTLRRGRSLLLFVDSQTSDSDYVALAHTRARVGGALRHPESVCSIKEKGGLS